MKFKLWLEAVVSRSKHIPYEYDTISISLPYNLFVNSVKKPITIEKDIEIKEEGQIYFYMPGRLVNVNLTEDDEVVNTLQFRLDSEFYSNDKKLSWWDATSYFENNEPVSVHIKINLNPPRSEVDNGFSIQCRNQYDEGYLASEFILPKDTPEYEIVNLRSCWGRGRYDLINLRSYGFSTGFDVENSIYKKHLPSAQTDAILELLKNENKLFKDFIGSRDIDVVPASILDILFDNSKEDKTNKFKKIFDIVNKNTFHPSRLKYNLTMWLFLEEKLKNSKEIELLISPSKPSTIVLWDSPGWKEIEKWINETFDMKFISFVNGFKTKIISIDQLYEVIEKINLYVKSSNSNLQDGYMKINIYSQRSAKNSEYILYYAIR